MSSNPLKKVERKLRNDIAPDLKPDAPVQPAMAPNRVAARGEAFETRSQALGQQARAAGATRTDNEADLLGFTAPRRKGAVRALLG